MTMQFRGAPVALTVRTQAQGAPTAEGDGVVLAQFQRATNNPNRPKRFLVKLSISNAGTTCQLTLWGRDVVGGAGVWGIPVDASGNFGVFGNGANIPANAVYYFVIEDMAGFSELVLVQSGNVGGTPVCTATMSPIIEGGR